jgi:hypothetical protein
LAIIRSVPIVPVLSPGRARARSRATRIHTKRRAAREARKGATTDYFGMLLLVSAVASAATALAAPSPALRVILGDERVDDSLRRAEASRKGWANRRAGGWRRGGGRAGVA